MTRKQNLIKDADPGRKSWIVLIFSVIICILVLTGLGDTAINVIGAPSELKAIVYVVTVSYVYERLKGLELLVFLLVNLLIGLMIETAALLSIPFYLVAIVIHNRSRMEHQRSALIFYGDNSVLQRMINPKLKTTTFDVYYTAWIAIFVFAMIFL